MALTEMNKERLVKGTYIFLSLAWMSFIFYFSSVPGAESTAQSRIIYEKLLWISLPDLHVNLITLIRKMAHFGEYFVLALLLMKLFHHGNNERKTKGYGNTRFATTKTVLTGVMYAISDEIHQLFVQGRAGTIIDVVIDTLGIIVGIIVFSIINIKKKGIIK